MDTNIESNSIINFSGLESEFLSVQSKFNHNLEGQAPRHGTENQPSTT